MPVYEYHCPDCNAQVEIFLRTRTEEPVCPSCRGKRLEKLISAPAGHVAGKAGSLPIAPGCPPAGAPYCHPNCCRIPQE